MSQRNLTSCLRQVEAERDRMEHSLERQLKTIEDTERGT